MDLTQESTKTLYQTTTVNGSAADTDLLVYENDHLAQVSQLEITGPDQQDFRLEVRDQDGSSATVKKNYASVSNLNRGEFDDPVLEWGASQEVAVVSSTSLSGDDYAVNLTVDEVER